MTPSAFGRLAESASLVAMSDVTTDPTDLLSEAGEKPAPRRRAADWPLMGDILSHRAGVPEHLLRWRRAQGEDDPDPML